MSSGTGGERAVESIHDWSTLGKYTIAVAEMLTGVKGHRLRRYEAAGLIQPSRTGGRQRLYSDRDIALIKRIAELESQGINLPGIRVILDMEKAEGASVPPTK